VTEVRLRQHGQARSFLAKVVRGGRVKAAVKTGDKMRQWVCPTITERLKAAEMQLRDVAIVAAIQSAEQGTPLSATLDALNGPQLMTLITALRQSAHAAGPRPVAVDAEFATVTPIRDPSGLAGNPPLSLAHNPNKEPK
jgi:hypothetical protein